MGESWANFHRSFHSDEFYYSANNTNIDLRKGRGKLLQSTDGTFKSKSGGRPSRPRRLSLGGGSSSSNNNNSKRGQLRRTGSCSSLTKVSGGRPRRGSIGGGATTTTTTITTTTTSPPDLRRTASHDGLTTEFQHVVKSSNRRPRRRGSLGRGSGNHPQEILHRSHDGSTGGGELILAKSSNGKIRRGSLGRGDNPAIESKSSHDGGTLGKFQSILGGTTRKGPRRRLSIG